MDFQILYQNELFTFESKPMEDGRLYVTSPELTGFRLIVGNTDDPEPELRAALNVYYPMYVRQMMKDASSF